MFHAVLSPYLNIGLLEPREVCLAALQALEQGAAPLAAVEGFIRQILGWREYVRGLYWLYMPEYAESNFFEATRPLPRFFWTGATDLRCLRKTIGSNLRMAMPYRTLERMGEERLAAITDQARRFLESIE